jgi:type I restriction enzyme M protein
VDEVDADKVKNDPRLPFGLPGVNKNGKVSSGNYLWISYFYSYLNEKGRAGFVMSSQASSAGRDEAKVRQKLIETGAVEAMVAIRSNFFYTRTVPCELWFLNRDKSSAGDGGGSRRRDKVLMLGAQRLPQVTRKITTSASNCKTYIISGCIVERKNASCLSSPLPHVVLKRPEGLVIQ